VRLARLRGLADFLGGLAIATYNRGDMITDSNKVTMRGTVEPGGKLRLDGPVPVKPGPVDVTVRPAGSSRSLAAEARKIVDMAGVGAELWEKLDVELYIQEMRDEWDRNIP